MGAAQFVAGTEYSRGGRELAPFPGVPTRVAFFRHPREESGTASLPFHEYFQPKYHLLTCNRMLPWKKDKAFRLWKGSVQTRFADRMNQTIYIHLVEFDRKRIIRMLYVYGDSGVVNIHYDSPRMHSYYKVFQTNGRPYQAYDRPDLTVNTLDFGHYQRPVLMPATATEHARYHLIGT